MQTSNATTYVLTDHHERHRFCESLISLRTLVRGGEQGADSSLLLLADGSSRGRGYFVVAFRVNHQNLRPYLEGELFLSSQSSNAKTCRRGATETLRISTFKIGQGSVWQEVLVSLLVIPGSWTIFFIIAVDPDPGQRCWLG